MKAIKLKSIKLNGNDRKQYNKKKIKELAMNIKANGLINPITVDKSKDGKLILIAGRRRFMALSVLYNEIPNSYINYVKLSTNKEKREKQIKSIRLSENLMRVNLQPYEEFEAVLKLKDDNLTNIEVANILGKNPKWVARRLALNNLIDEAKDLFKKLSQNGIDGQLEIDNDRGKLTLGHFEVLASYTHDIQYKVFNSDTFFGINFIDSYKPEMLRKRINDILTTDLSTAIFPLTKEIKIIGRNIGSCKNCLENSNTSPELFDFDKKKPHCLNKECFETKTKAELSERFTKMCSNFGDVKCRYISNNYNADGAVISCMDWESSNDENALYGLSIDGENIGKVIRFHMTKEEELKSHEIIIEKKEMTDEERWEKLYFRRARVVVKEFIELLSNDKEKYPTNTNVLRIIATLGVDGWGTLDEVITTIENFTDDQVYEKLWALSKVSLKKLLAGIIGQPARPNKEDRLLLHSLFQCFGKDFDKELIEAEKEVKTPKSLL